MFEDNVGFVVGLNHLVKIVEHQLDDIGVLSKQVERQVQHALKLVEEMELNNLEGK